MLLDLSCPLELIEHELTRDDLGKVRAYISLYNLSDRPVVRIEGAVHWICSRTDARVSAPFIADRLVTESQRPFKIQLSSADCPGADGLEVTFRQLKFDGGRKWIGRPEDLLRIEPPSAPPGSELNRLVAAAGADARHFPVDAGAYWLCVCGRPNAAGEALCARCARVKDAVLTRLSRENVLSGATPALHAPAASAEIPRFLTGEPAPPDKKDVAARVLAALQAQCRAQRTVLLRRTLFLLAAIAVMAALVSSWRWLSAQSDLAKDIRPAVRIEQTPPS